MVVPKRAAILLDRLMVALHHALEDENNDLRSIRKVYGRKGRYLENDINRKLISKFPTIIFTDLPNDFDGIHFHQIFLRIIDL